MRKWMDHRKPVQKRALRRLDLSNIYLSKTLGRQLTGLEKVYCFKKWICLDEYFEGMFVENFENSEYM